MDNTFIVSSGCLEPDLKVVASEFYFQFKTPSDFSFLTFDEALQLQKFLTVQLKDKGFNV